MTILQQSGQSLVTGEYRGILAGMADAWRAAGATAFGVWRGGRWAEVWPAQAVVQSPDLIAPVNRNGQFDEALGLAGLPDEAAWIRLQMDANLMAALLHRDNDLNVMISDLSEIQDQLLALYELAQSMRSQLDVSQLVQALTRQAMRLTKPYAAFTWFITSDNTPIYQACPEALISMDVLPEIFQHAKRAAQPLMLTGNDLPKGFPKGVENLYIIPIQLGGVTIAALGLLFGCTAEALSPELKLSLAIARQAEVYFENVLLHEDVLRQTRLRTALNLARQIQFSLLPRELPNLPGLDVYAAMRPAEEVGGDFYTFQQRSDGSLIFTVADAAGKGMPAALVMSMTHTIINSGARFMPVLSPRSLIGRAIQDLYHNFTETGLFVTLFAGQYFPERRSLSFANAGHSPVVFCSSHTRRGARAELLEADSPPMGVLFDNLANDYDISFKPGDILIAATDGFSEANNAAQEMFGYQRLLDMAEALADRSAREIATAFYQAMDDFQGGQPQADDQTVVVIKGVD